MKKPMLKQVAQIGLMAMAASGIALGQDAKKEEPATPVAEAAVVMMDPAVMKTDSSYALGYRTGGSFAEEFGRYGVTLDDIEMETFIKGFTAAVKSEEPGMEQEKLQAAMAALGTALEQREKDSAAANLKAGQEFLAKNKDVEGVKTLESGLQYKILEKGGDQKYEAPKEGAPEKQFLVNYKGSMIDGTEFDASPEGQPVPMTLQVVPGFREALTMMPVGAKWKLFIPSELAYGEERRSAEIGPNSVLIFELELAEIKDAPVAPIIPGLQLPQGPQGQ